MKYTFSPTAQQCGTIGSQSTTPFVPLTVSAFYLNIEERTKCSGYVSELNLSFYNMGNEQGTTNFGAYIAFYRPQSEDKDTFFKVSEKIEITVVNVSPVADSNLNSATVPLSPAVFLENDTLLGICIPESTPDGTEPLHVVSNNVSSIDVMNNRLLIGSCDENNQVPDQIGLPDIASMRNVTLHIHASVGKKSHSEANSCI